MSVAGIVLSDIGGLFVSLPSTSVDRNQRDIFFPSYILNDVPQGYYSLQLGSLFLQGKVQMDPGFLAEIVFKQHVE